ncbi:GNAT family N-acetyltransferase [Candidatus Uabimicrobium sp. HlEnr_7]|uniref:GNAT family N-acetyltransferase n=1 Tax=Candidatus Uabimicrobium helgolandensis TaxID=3095367 RepID=UPI0035561C87
MSDSIILELSDITIEILYAADLPNVIELERQTVGAQSTEQYHMLTREEHYELIDQGVYIGAKYQQKIIAFSSMRFHAAEELFCGIHINEPFVSFVNTLVHAKFRGKGLQFLLQKQREKLAQQKGYQIIMATVSPENQHSLRNVEKFGFSIVETRDLSKGKRHIVCKKLEIELDAT